MEFMALGPVSVVRDDVEIDLGAPRQRAVIALLLIHRNQVLSTDRMLDELWGDDNDGKLNALRVYVSRLRAALEPEREHREHSVIETVGHGYRLNVGPDGVDVDVFERGAAQGRALLSDDPTAAAATLHAALELWHGAAYQDQAHEEFARFESMRLDSARIDAIEDRIEADLACGLDGELVSELEQLRREHPLRERLVEHHAVALYRSGRGAEALRTISQFRRHVGDELGIEVSPRLVRLEEQVLLHDDHIQPRRPSVSLGGRRPAINPYKGLRSFGADDAARFFGRDALVTDVLRHLARGQRLVAVIGASGSGKSSLVRAGVVPALAKGAIDGSADWLIATMTPGAHPFAEVDAALIRSTPVAPDGLAEQLGDGDVGLLRAALRVLPRDDAHLLLVIDQFEELFTLVGADARQRFLSNIVAAVDDPHGRMSVVLTLRADYYAEQLSHPGFGTRLGAGIINVTPMSAEELEAAAIRPAAAEGVTFEPALLGRLIADVGTQPGALPLFQYALTELFDRRDGDVLTVDSYRAMGGLDGALQRRASDLFDEFDDTQQDAARQLFLRLVVLGQDAQHSRRRVTAREVTSLAVDPVAMQTVIERFGEHRLLSFDSEPLTGAPTVEVAHEALLSSWPTLAGWIDESHEDLRHHASLTRALGEWRLAGRNSDYLLPAGRLDELQTWAATSAMALNDDERAYLAASAERIEHDRAEHASRARAQRRAQRRLWATVGVLGVSLGVAALFLFGVVGGDERPQLVYLGARNDFSWSGLIGSGVTTAAVEFDLDLESALPLPGPGDGFRALARSGPDMIVTSADVYRQDPDVVADHPAVDFGLVGAKVVAPNAWSVTFADEEGGYLAGVAAALASETGVIGFIGGEHFSNEQFRAGFEAGAAKIDPEITVLATYVDEFDEDRVDGFSDPVRGAERALTLFRRDADVVFAAAGTSQFGVLRAALAESAETGRHRWVIGVDNDLNEVVDEPAQRPHVLTSLIKRGDEGTRRLVEAMVTGNDTRHMHLGVVDDVWRLTESDGLTEPMLAELGRERNDVAAGRVEVPLGPRGDLIRSDDAGSETAGPSESSVDRVVHATAFWEAVAAGERDVASSYVDPVALLTGTATPHGRARTLEGQFDWYEVVGWRWALEECTMRDTGVVSCTVAARNAWSDVLGVEPIEGSFAVRFDEDRIVSVLDESGSFRDDWMGTVFGEFAGWVQSNHPIDAHVMFNTGRDVDPEILSLFEINTERFVDAHRTG